MEYGVFGLQLYVPEDSAKAKTLNCILFYFFFTIVQPSTTPLHGALQRIVNRVC
jgi:hypothetical protein